MSTSINRRFLATSVAIIFVGSIARLWQLGSANLWVDESLTAQRAAIDISEFFQLLSRHGTQQPFYFLSLHLFPTHTEFLLRFPGALMGILGIALLIFVVWRFYGNTIMALWVGALLALNPYHVWMSRTARPYALLFVLGVIASYAFLMMLRRHQNSDGSVRRERSPILWLVFILSSMAAYSTHYFGLVLPMAQFFTFVLMGRDERFFFRRWFIAQAIAGTPFLIWVIFFTARNAGQFVVDWIPQATLLDIPLTLANYSTGYEGRLTAYFIPALIVAALGIVPGLVAAFRERHQNEINLYWGLLITAPLISILIIAIRRPLYMDRYFIILVSAVLILMLLGWQRLFSPQRMAILGSIVLLTGGGFIIHQLSNGDYERAEWQAVAHHIEAHVEPGESVYFFALPVTFNYYYDGPPLAVSESYLEPTSETLWIIYRNPNEHIHRQNVMPAFDPLRDSDEPFDVWLREQNILAQEKFQGVHIYKVAVATDE